ncbi:hypothetical protein [Lentiprolixibacter aurantiacus]|uniref:Uncharacterized protein n=1 Tax=Lentiprolixibacter aurantiacus TaxID=2993939 RepID=A0AAE3SPG5_9FLAO|nr:hypothetical protein [Lentiprolixibacter aurantiacus]MCX2720792.1 hypothetical protein [Lentiprolixibacter aurantiacus]
MNNLFLSGRLSALLVLLTIFFVGCKSDPKKQEASEAEASEPEREVIEVVTRSMEFFAPDTINSGWNTFVYKNLSTEPHFILLDKYPEGITIENTIAEVAPAFEEGMAMIMEGKMEEAMAAFGKLPEWFGQVVFSGGTGLISPRETAISTLNLAPGYYIMECYVRMPDGRFHTSMGMAKEFIIRSEDSGNKPPEANVSITISSEDGINYSGNMTKGTTIFSVTYEDQIVHENFVGHDVNLVRMEEGADLDALEAWINWASPTGLMSSKLPEGFTFLGGTNDAPAGSVQYFEADLSPGTYAFISEVPGSKAKGMLKTFSISD